MNPDAGTEDFLWREMTQEEEREAAELHEAIRKACLEDFKEELTRNQRKRERRKRRGR